MKKLASGDIYTKLSRFLLQHHITPSTVTGHSPAEILMGRRLRTVLDRTHPEFMPHRNMKEQSLLPSRQFRPGDKVYSRNYRPGPKWIPATVDEAFGPVSYKVVTSTGQIERKHVDQLRLDRGAVPPSSVRPPLCACPWGSRQKAELIVLYLRVNMLYCHVVHVL